MGKVVYEDPIHHISGKISRKYRTCYNYRKPHVLQLPQVE